MARLGRWLGPWASDEVQPSGVRRERIQQGQTEAYVYRGSRKPRRSLLLLPGLHFLGHEHPKLERFARILATAGYLVMTPELRAFRTLRVENNIFTDAENARRALSGLPDRPTETKPDVMSISFSSAAALHLASQEEIGRLFIFGGFSNWEDALRFSIAGRGSLPHDPLNRPAVYINLLPHMQVPAEEHASLRGAWLGFCRRTWGRPEMKARARYQPIAEELSRAIHEEFRPLFLEGCAADHSTEQALVRCEEALRRSEGAFDWLEPATAAGMVRAKTTLIHGRRDDVIPVSEANRLAAYFSPETPVEVLVTGFYSHTQSERENSERVTPFGELKTLLRILKALGAQT